MKQKISLCVCIFMIVGILSGCSISSKSVGVDTKSVKTISKNSLTELTATHLYSSLFYYNWIAFNEEKNLLGGLTQRTQNVMSTLFQKFEKIALDKNYETMFRIKVDKGTIQFCTVLLDSKELELLPGIENIMPQQNKNSENIIWQKGKISAGAGTTEGGIPSSDMLLSMTKEQGVYVSVYPNERMEEKEALKISSTNLGPITDYEIPIEKKGVYYVKIKCDKEFFDKDTSLLLGMSLNNNKGIQMRKQNTVYIGTTSSEETLYYKFVLNTDSRVNFYSNTGLSITLCDQNKKAIRKKRDLLPKGITNEESTNGNNVTYSLKAGTYYVHISTSGLFDLGWKKVTKKK